MNKTFQRIKQFSPIIVIMFFVLCTVIAVKVLAPTSSSCMQIVTEDRLQSILSERTDSLVFCTQELCGGCESVESDLVTIAQEQNIQVYKYEVTTATGQALLKEYGLDQVPAIIKISSDQVNVYKSYLTRENIMRIIDTEFIKYEQIEGIEDISYSAYKQKLNSNTDFFAIFGSPLCSDCTDFLQVVQHYTSQNTTRGMYYINLHDLRETLSQDEYQSIISENNINWIPYIVHVKNGVIVSYYEYPEQSHRGDNNGLDPDSQAAQAFYNWFKNELL